MMARAPIDPAALTWAREISRVTVSDLARAISVKPSRVNEFESGDALPTFRQLTLIAGKLDRPLGFFFAPPPAVSDVPDTADFRGRADEQLPAALAKEMRRAEQHRDAMLDLGGRPERHVEVEPITWDNIAERAADLRRQFGLNLPTIRYSASGAGYWKIMGFLFSRQRKYPCKSFEGYLFITTNCPS